MLKVIKSKLEPFIFYSILTWLFWEFGQSIKNIAQNLYFSGFNISNPIFSLTYTQNTGGAFSILNKHTGLLIIFGIVILVALIVYTFKKITMKTKWEMLIVGLLSAGVLGNLIERIKFGHVIDYIHLNFINFPIFNIFDIYITTAALLVIVSTLRAKK